MRISIPEFETKKQLHNFLRSNKKELISKKRSLPIKAAPVSMPVHRVNSKSNAFKSNEAVVEDLDVLRVKVVANSANWVDSHQDMLLPNAPLRSIKNNKHMIPHLHDHVHSVMAEVGDVVDIYLQDISLRELGLDKDGSTQSVIFVTDIKKKLNEKVFERYKSGKIRQHSIGLQYMNLELAIDDEDSEKEYDFFKKYYDQAINPEQIDKYGYFWIISEYKLIENSAVLFGANELTPTLDNNLKLDDNSFEIEHFESIDTAKTARKLEALNDLLETFKN